MPFLRNQQDALSVAVRLGALALGLCLLGSVGGVQARAQDTLALTHVIAVQSDPPGATVWKRNGRDYTCIGALTPASVEVAFHGENDLQRLYLRKFGYATKTLDVKATDKDVAAALGQSNSSSFLLGDNAPADLKQLNAALMKEFEKTILGNREAFRCAPFTLDYITLAKNKETGAVELSVAVTLDRTFGGSAFRLASHASAAERSQKMGQVALESGIAEILGRFHHITAMFPDLKMITVLGSYSTTEAVLDTRTTPRTYQTRQIVIYEGSTSRLQMVGEWKGGDKYTVVKDQDVDRAITFVMPAAQIPDTLDKKAITDAVLAKGTIYLAH